MSNHTCHVLAHRLQFNEQRAIINKPDFDDIESNPHLLQVSILYAYRVLSSTTAVHDLKYLHVIHDIYIKTLPYPHTFIGTY